MLYIFLIAVLVSVLQMSAVTYARVGSSVFDLQIIVLAFFSLRYGFRIGIALGIFFGVFNGIFSSSSFWLTIFLYTLTGFVIGYIGRLFYKENVLTFLIMVFCSLVFIYFLQYIFRPQSLQTGLSIPDYFFRLFLPTLLYNIPISIFFFYFLRGLKV